MRSFRLFENNPNRSAEIDFYPSADPVTQAAVLIFPGGAYQTLSEHEGRGYAEFFNVLGMHAFVLRYSLTPHYFPDPLLDARRAIRFLRFHAVSFGVNPQQILAVGSSAGAHLAALLSVDQLYLPNDVNDVVDQEDFHASAQVLCYPVVLSTGPFAHLDSFRHLLGPRYEERQKFDLSRLVASKTPKTFLWSCANDALVPVENTYAYAKELAAKHVPYECHVFQEGGHGIGLAPKVPSVHAWTLLLENWLKSNGFLPR